MGARAAKPAALFVLPTADAINAALCLADAVRPDFPVVAAAGSAGDAAVPAKEAAAQAVDASAADVKQPQLPAAGAAPVTTGSSHGRSGGEWPLSALALLDTHTWPALPAPAPDGWLNVVKERGQSYAQFVTEHTAVDKSILRSPFRERWHTVALVCANADAVAAADAAVVPVVAAAAAAAAAAAPAANGHAGGPATAAGAASVEAKEAKAAARRASLNLPEPPPLKQTRDAASLPPPDPLTPHDQKLLALAPALATTADDAGSFAAFFRAFFMPLRAEVCAPLTRVERFDMDSGRSRCAETGQWHVSTKAMTECARSARKKEHHAALVCVGRDELYRGDDTHEWEIGQAVPDWRVCCVSYARYVPPHATPPAGVSVKSFVRARVLKLAAHECCHLFRLSHCTHLHCLMNGRQNEREDHATPFDLCPVCLVKLQRALRFDPVARYRALIAWYDAQEAAVVAAAPAAGTAGGGGFDWRPHRALAEQRLQLLQDSAAQTRVAALLAASQASSASKYSHGRGPAPPPVAAAAAGAAAAAAPSTPAVNGTAAPAAVSAAAPSAPIS